MDGSHAHAPAVHIQLRQDGQTATDAALSVKVPVVLLRQPDHLCVLDGPAGENGVAVEALGVLPVHQFDELQAEHVVHAQVLRQFFCGIPLTGADAAVVQLVGQDHVVGPDLRAGFQEVAQLRQVYAPLHIEHQDTQGVLCLFGCSGDVVNLRLRELGDHGHDLLLRGMVQQRTQALAFIIGKSVHGMGVLLHLLVWCLTQVERMISSGSRMSSVCALEPLIFSNSRSTAICPCWYLCWETVVRWIRCSAPKAILS